MGSAEANYPARAFSGEGSQSRVAASAREEVPVWGRPSPGLGRPPHHRPTMRAISGGV